MASLNEDRLYTILKQQQLRISPMIHFPFDPSKNLIQCLPKGFLPQNLQHYNEMQKKLFDERLYTPRQIQTRFQCLINTRKHLDTLKPEDRTVSRFKQTFIQEWQKMMVSIQEEYAQKFNVSEQRFKKIFYCRGLKAWYLCRMDSIYVYHRTEGTLMNKFNNDPHEQAIEAVKLSTVSIDSTETIISEKPRDSQSLQNFKEKGQEWIETNLKQQEDFNDPSLILKEIKPVYLDRSIIQSIKNGPQKKKKPRELKNK